MRLEGAGEKIKGAGELAKVDETVPKNKITSDSANPIAFCFPYRVFQAPKLPQPVNSGSWYYTHLTRRKCNH